MFRRLGAMDSTDSHIVRHLPTSWQPTWQPSLFTHLLFQAAVQNTQNVLALQFKSVTEDIATERETYAQSRQGLDTLYIDVQKKLQDESTARQVYIGISNGNSLIVRRAA